MVDHNKFYDPEYFKASLKLKATCPELFISGNEGIYRRILFFYIGCCHIRDQYFYDQIIKASIQMEKETKKFGLLKFDKFVRILSDVGIYYRYGLRDEGRSAGWSLHISEPDVKWWQKVWEKIRHKQDVKIKWMPEGYEEK
jgi:hypothetical protein